MPPGRHCDSACPVTFAHLAVALQGYFNMPTRCLSNRASTFTCEASLFLAAQKLELEASIFVRTASCSFLSEKNRAGENGDVETNF